MEQDTSSKNDLSEALKPYTEMQALSLQGFDPFEWYRTMRESQPVYYDPQRFAWQVFRYDDVKTVLTEHTIFSSHHPTSEAGDNPLDASLIGIDPPRHRELRQLVSLAFSPATIARLEPSISQIVNELLDKVEHRKIMEVVDDFAYPLPIMVISELLGIPLEDREQFKLWSDKVLGVSYEDAVNAQHAIARYFLDLLQIRSRNPRSDLISALAEAHLEGKKLTSAELVGFCVLLLVAGFETTTTLIGNAILCLDDDHEALQQLITEPDLLPGAIEETLRFRPPLHTLPRVAKVDTTLNGQKIAAGQSVMPWFASANRDEAQFPNADTFDIRRSPNRHLGFGYGIHFCLGAPLARLEGNIALKALLTRLPNIRRIREVPLEPKESVLIYGMKHIPIRFG